MSEVILDRFIILAAVLISALLLILTVSKDKLREATAIFFFKQTMTWSFGLLVAEWGLIEYPVRELVRASASSFSFEYFIYPSVCVVFNLKYPEMMVRKILWILGFPTILTITEVVIERKTELINYVHWTWYWSWIAFFITFMISRAYYHWFFNKQQRNR